MVSCGPGGRLQQPRLAPDAGRGLTGAPALHPPACSLSSLSWHKLKDKGWPPPQQPQSQPQQPQQPLGPWAALWLAAPQQAAQHSAEPPLQQHPQQGWWQRWQQRRRPRPPSPPLPTARWQAGAAPVAGLGMLVHGGDAPRPASKGKQPPGSNSTADAWLLRLPELRWQRGCACQYNDSSGACVSSPEAPAPSPRRAHTLASYEVGWGGWLAGHGRLARSSCMHVRV